MRKVTKTALATMVLLFASTAWVNTASAGGSHHGVHHLLGILDAFGHVAHTVDSLNHHYYGHHHGYYDHGYHHGYHDHYHGYYDYYDHY